MHIFFETKTVKRSRALCAYILFYASTSACNLIFHLPALNLAVNLLTTFIITLLFEDTLRKKVFVTFLIYIINMVCDIISAFTFGYYNMYYENYAVFEIFTVLFILICELIVEKIVTVKNDTQYRMPYLYVLMLIPFCSISVLYFLTASSGNAVIVLSGCGILIINIIVFYLYNAIARTYMQKYESELLKQQLAVFQNQLEVITQSQEKIRSLKHDMKHHIKELMFMAEKSNTGDIAAYLNQMLVFTDTPSEYVSSGNLDTDGIINYMLQKAEDVLKDVNVKICIPEQFSSHSFDLNIILGNLLENAIDAASETYEKKLYFNMELNKGIIFIKISNSYHGEIKMRCNKIITTKADISNHGIGLDNVKRIVKLHDGSIDISYGDGMFHTDVMLYADGLR